MVIGIIGFIFGLVGFIVASFSWLKMTAMEKSTHQIQYVPIEEQARGWATDQAALEKEQKLYNDELKDEMGEFSLSDDDKKIFSL